jgi:hypothetical protein
MAKTHFTVVRNAAYTASSIGVSERHNERKNEAYYNADIVPERACMNVHFHQNFTPDGTVETYEQSFNRMLEEGTIVKRGLRADAKVFDELVYDVNTAYFEENGGYDFAKKFYEEVYRQAVKEVGSEDYILSAVMHADEKNIALSEHLGRDVFHYHIHVVYVPVVEKEVLWTKRCKDQELVGTIKEVIPQISHSKKWPRYKDETGKWINSYTLLQDRYFENMKQAGFIGFERGERGSTAEHLEVLDYKIQQDNIRLEQLDKQVERKESQLERLDEKVSVKAKAAATVKEIETMGKPALLGSGFSVTADEMKTLKTLAKKSVNADKKIADANRRRDTAAIERNKAVKERDELKGRTAAAKKHDPTITEHLRWFNKFIEAFRRAPKRLMQVIEDIMRSPPERSALEREAPERDRNRARTEAR